MAGVAKVKPKKSPCLDLSSPEAAEEFRLAAAAWGKRVNRSPETALAELVKMGIATKSGKLTKPYR